MNLIEDNFNYFKYDSCYKSNIDNDVSLNTYLETNFTIEKIVNAKECQEKAVSQDSQFFVLSDLSNNTSNCYIPKATNTLSSLFEPVSETIQDIVTGLIGNDNLRLSQKVSSIEISNNMSLIDKNNSCLKYSVDDYVYAPSKKFALYKLDILDTDFMNKLTSIKPYDYYKKQQTTLNSYNDLLKLGNSDNPTDVGILANDFKKYICNPDRNNEANFKNQLSQLKIKYDNFFYRIDEISTDLSNISALTKDSNAFIESLDEQISFQKKQLANLYGLGGANNGKLSDTRYLKNIKITEIILLSLVIATVIFIYSKK